MEYAMEELIPVVAWLSEKYTHKESSSISYEKANQLMEAVLYCIHELEETGDGKQALTGGHRLSAREAYERGAELVVEKTKQANQRYSEIAAGFHDYGNRACRDTFIKGIPGFFQSYDAKYNPQNTILTLDYPTLIFTAQKKSGIDAISDYITDMGLEQEFLSRMPEEFVRRVLREYHSGYEELFINLAGVVQRNILQKMIQRNPFLTDIKTMSKEDLKAELVKLLTELVETQYQGNQKLLAYLSADLEDFAVMLQIE